MLTFELDRKYNRSSDQLLGHLFFIYLVDSIYWTSLQENNIHEKKIAQIFQN